MVDRESGEGESGTWPYEEFKKRLALLDKLNVEVVTRILGKDFLVEAATYEDTWRAVPKIEPTDYDALDELDSESESPRHTGPHMTVRHMHSTVQDIVAQDTPVPYSTDEDHHLGFDNARRSEEIEGLWFYGPVTINDRFIPDGFVLIHYGTSRDDEVPRMCVRMGEIRQKLLWAIFGEKADIDKDLEYEGPAEEAGIDPNNVFTYLDTLCLAYTELLELPIEVLMEKVIAHKAAEEQ